MYTLSEFKKVLSKLPRKYSLISTCVAMSASYKSYVDMCSEGTGDVDCLNYNEYIDLVHDYILLRNNGLSTQNMMSVTGYSIVENAYWAELRVDEALYHTMFEVIENGNLWLDYKGQSMLDGNEYLPEAVWDSAVSNLNKNDL